MKLVFFFSLIAFISCQQQNSFPIDTEERLPRPIYDVVVVGAGLTGLSFARKMRQLRPNATVLLLEARGQVGGRVRTRSLATAMGDDFLDLGSQFISRDHHALQNLAERFGVKLVPQSSCGERTLLLEGVRRRKREVSWSPDLSVRPSFRELIESPDAGSLAKQSVADFVQSQKLSTTDTAATNRLLQTLFDAPEQKVSAIQVALTAASDNATVTELLLNTGHGQSLLFLKGAYDFIRTLADGCHVEFNQKVVGINRQSSPAVVMTSSSSFLARQVVVTVPPVVASMIVFSPPLESSFQGFLEQYRPQGDAYYFTLTYPTAFWRAKNKSGQIIHTSSVGPLAWLTTFDTTTDTHCVSANGITGILWGIAHFVDNISEQDRFGNYSKIVKKALETELDPLDIKDMQLSSDPLALGSIGVLPPGTSLDWLNYLQGASQHGQNTFFASAELSNVSTGLMNGAVVSGETAAQMVASALNELARDSSSPSKPFVYSTSTHYPPMDDSLHIMLAPALARDPQPRSSTPFQYSTSTHYPSTMLQNFVSEDADVQQNDPQTQFIYQTSSMYPPTEKPLVTSTYRHFSFGNLNEEDPANMIADPYTDKQSVVGNGGFAYRTSTQYPPTQSPLATSTFTHFSFGNLGQAPQPPFLPPATSIQLRSQSVQRIVSPVVVSEIQQVAQSAPRTDALIVAKNISAILHEILEGLHL